MDRKKIKKQTFSGVIVTRRAEGEALDYWLSLLSGDTVTVQFLLGDQPGHIHPNSVFDTSDVEEWKNYRFNTQALRIWSLTYEEEFTCPLFVTASRGYAECLQLLLRQGANVDFAPGGETALHGACENAHTECAKILLSYGANPNVGSQDGAHPLHCCKSPESYQCAKLLLQYGAYVNSQTEDEEETPLHVAAQLGLVEHVDLYLRYGASVNKRDNKGETPLCAACSAPQTCDMLESHYLVCERLIQAGANIHARDHEQQNPLHLACKSANPRVVELLLAQGAEVNAMSYSGNTAMQNILQVSSYRLPNQPELIVRALLNHGAIRVWPGALIKKHPEFFQSVFSLHEGPRSLQHLCRCCLRSHLEGKLHQVLPKLPLPPKLLRFLQLEFEDVVY
ncbi:ankyrin repeat and SOCS box protein 10 isoform X3 [Xenopus laevis]|uniref:Ankyrin repeat and SOCS box protein 10 isoform X3 n=1 Tax=Xenopus laevis TaxID=8355 RepID=A0A8J1KWE4_XENLA|nr:ankyrin repeat and SOCS box protein 10 isoform X3 [Xenopus laevis]